MKKVYIITAILASLVLVAMLIGIGYGIGGYTKPQVVVKTPILTATPTPEPTRTPPIGANEEMYTDAPMEIPENFDEIKKNAPQPVTQREYINYEQGYKITFPEDWMGWFLIDDSEADDVRIIFYGKSEAGRFGEWYCDRYGLSMFNIVTESTMYSNPDWDITYDNKKIIGTVQGENIYKGVTFVSMGLLRYASWTTYYDEEERELAAKDDEKLSDMINNTEFLKATFEEI